MFLALFGSKQSNVPLWNGRRSGTRKPPHAKRLSFDALEERMVLSQCAYWFPPPGQQVPDPPERGDYSRPPVDITWTCEANDSLARLQGHGSATLPDTNDPGTFITTTIDAGETWILTGNDWTRDSVDGTVIETRKKDVPDVYSELRFVDEITVSGGTVLIEIAKSYDIKRDIGNGMEFLTDGQWFERYSPADGSMISKEGDDREVTKTRFVPFAGLYELHGDFTEWTGPKAWTRNVTRDEVTAYNGGGPTLAVMVQEDQAREFARFTDEDPIKLGVDKITQLTTWYPSGQKAQFNYGRDFKYTDFILAQTDERITTIKDDWLDNDSNSIQKDSSEYTRTLTGANGVSQVVTFFDRVTQYFNDNGRPTHLSARYENTPPGGAFQSYRIEANWDRAGNFHDGDCNVTGMVSVDSTVGAKALFAWMYGKFELWETSTVGWVSIYAYPELKGLFR